jgi:tetratricopeptide (TPR) repeat protein
VRISPIRAATVLLLLFPLSVGVPLSTGCARGSAIDPALLGAVDSVEPDVKDLVDRHVALVRAAPSSAKAHATLGLVYEANELWVPAAASYANAAKLDPSQPLWDYHRSISLREAGNVEEADRLLRDSAARLPDVPGVQHRLGSALFDAGDLDAAAEAFQRALAKAPEQPEILVGLAFVDLGKDDFAGARDLCFRALKKDSAYQQAHYALGLAYRGLGDAKNAYLGMTQGAAGKRRYLDDPLTAELRTYQVNTMSLVAEANRLGQAQRRDEALALWARIAERNPRDKAMLTNYGSSLLTAGRVDEAIATLERSLALDPNEPVTLVNLCEAYVAAQKLDLALERGDKAVALAPDSSRAHRARARALAARQNYTEAYAELQEAVRIDPKDPTSEIALGEMCTLVGKSQEAVAAFRSALDLDPTNLPVRVNLAFLTLRSGDAEGARIQLKELQRMAPDQPRVKALAAELGVGK